MSTKQERQDKARKTGIEKAEAIIAEAYARVTARSDHHDVADGTHTRPEGLSDASWALALQVRAQRDAGVAWWQIAFKLNLPGSAPTVAQGKAGAAFARRLYAAGFGDVPRTQRVRGTGPKVHPGVKEVKATPKRERVEQVRAGTSVLRPDMTDAEVLDLLRGRHIGWTGNINNVDGKGDQFFEQEADVHKVIARIEVQGGVRCIAFKEVERNAPLKFREIPMSTRVVRLSTIHTVR